MKTKKFIQIILFLFIVVFFNINSVYSSELPKNLTQNEKNTILIYQQASLSVVNVSNIKIARNWMYGEFQTPRGSGSGFVWDVKGHIVTNFHVVEGGDQFLISFKNDKKQYKANLVGVDPKKDIAVLKLIKKPKKIVPITPSKQKEIFVGQKAIAIGNPFGLDHTLTTGVISATGRRILGIGGVEIWDMLQTDASINPGNSGGPLLDSSGNLIGMNTLIFSKSGASAGVGFAVSVFNINRIVPQLIKYGRIIRPSLGIGVLPDQIKNRFVGDKGIVIYHVNPTGPAFKAGLRGITQNNFGEYVIGDIILKINNDELNSYSDIYNILDKYKEGDIVNVLIKRKSKKLNIKVKLTSTN